MEAFAEKDNTEEKREQDEKAESAEKTVSPGLATIS